MSVGPGRRLPRLGLAVAALAACTTTTPLAPSALHNPRDLAITCVRDGSTRSLKGCSGKELRALVTSGSRGSIAVGRPHVPEWIDNDKAIPGYTPLPVAGLPEYVTILDGDPAQTYVTLPLRRAVARLDTLSGKETGRIALGFSPAALLPESAHRRLFLADPAGGALWYVPLSAFDDGGAAVQVRMSTRGGSEPVGGSPHSLALAGGRLFVGHLHHGHLTVLDTATLALVARLPIDPQCADGIDNDGDGRTDADDSGCDDPADPFEGDPELGPLCDNGKDDDGDGAVDALDLGCQATAAHDGCRDGLDNDGDGLTDFPDDPGCAGFAGASEARDNPSCSDGLDNDGDGLTDLADPECATSTADTELPAVRKEVIGACGDGLDNDGDGLTDLADPDCEQGPGSGAEARPPCADGIDNDGDGLTDLADESCYNRASPSEVAPDTGPATVLGASFSGRYLLVGHRRRRQLLVLDTATLHFVEPVPGQTTPFVRASHIGARVLPAGIDVGRAPLAIAPVKLDGRDAFVVTFELSGMYTVRLFDASGKLAIGLVPATGATAGKAGMPYLQVDGDTVDMSVSVPSVYASFGARTKKQLNADDRNPVFSYGGFTLSDRAVEHRAEAWRFVYQGRLPGALRHGGRFVRADTFVDPQADFCRLGVIPGDLLLVHRGAGAKDCGGLRGEVLRYTVAKVDSDRLLLRNKGVIDVPVTAGNQSDYDSAAARAIDLPDLACMPRSGITYELRADGWLVVGKVSGLGTSRPRNDVGCSPWSDQDPAAAARLVEPTPATQGGKPVALPACPITDEVVARALVQRPYGGGEPEAVSGFHNAVLSGRLLPGCGRGGGTSGLGPHLLPSIRDMIWTVALTPGFSPRSSGIGVLGVAVVSHPDLGYVYTIDQGAGSLHAVLVSDGGVVQTLE